MQSVGEGGGKHMEADAQVTLKALCLRAIWNKFCDKAHAQ